MRALTTLLNLIRRIPLYDSPPLPLTPILRIPHLVSRLHVEPLAVITKTTFSSTKANVCPKQLRGPNSKGLQAPFIGCKGSSGPTSQRSGVKASRDFQYFGLQWRSNAICLCAS
jgi:hypothetical protein